MRFRLMGLVIGAAMLSSRGALAVTKYPGLNYVHPVAVTRGATSVVTIDTNGDVANALSVLVEGAGVDARLPPRDAKLPKGQTAVELRVAPDAAIGPREIRVVTKEAVTTVGRFFVTHRPTVLEGRRNDTPAAAQAMSLPTVVCGRVEDQVDEDWYRFDAKAGEHVAFAVLGVRMHDTIHKIGRFINHFDAMLRVVDANGVEVAANDDYYFADPLVTFTAPRDGQYFVCLREATYKGNPFYTYALVGHKGPWATGALPMALPAGRKERVELLGFGFDTPTLADLSLPIGTRPWSVRDVAPLGDGGVTNEIPMLARDIPLASESEPNDVLATAPKVDLPVAASGVLTTPGDRDCFKFAAKKGITYQFEMFSRRLYTPVDGQLRVLDGAGKALTVMDDGQDEFNRRTKDPILAWTAPRDGDFYLEIADAMGAGGPTHGYITRMAAAVPNVFAVCAPDLFMIGPGDRSPLFVKVQRRDGYKGDLRVRLSGLPVGVRANEAVVPEGVDAVTLTLEADAKAERVAGHAELEVRAANGDGPTTKAHVLAEIYQAGYRIPVHAIAVAVTEPSDIRVEAPVTSLEIKPGGAATIPIKITRASKYKGERVLLGLELQRFASPLPKGVTIDPKKSRLTLLGEQTEGQIVLACDPKALPVGPIAMTAVGQVSVEFSVNVQFCSRPFTLRVAP